MPIIMTMKCSDVRYAMRIRQLYNMHSKIIHTTAKAAATYYRSFTFSCYRSNLNLIRCKAAR